MLQLRAIWSCRRPRSYRRRSISLIFRMDTFSWATKSPPRPVEELHSPVVQHLRPDELFFRKSFRHVNNDSDGGDFSIHLFSESLIHMPGIFIQNLSEHPIHIARNPHSRRRGSDWLVLLSPRPSTPGVACRLAPTPLPPCSS